MPRALPLKLPSELRVMRSAGCIGATAISPAGDEISAWERSQPANSVSAIGTGAAYRPAALMIAKPPARPAPPPLFLRYPGQRQARLRESLPQPRLPAVVCAAVDDLRIRQIREDFCCCCSNDIGALTHDACRFVHGLWSSAWSGYPSSISRHPRASLAYMVKRSAGAPISHINLRLIAEVTKSSVIVAVVPYGA